MQRRKFLKYGVASVIVLGGGGSYLWLTKERKYIHLSLEAGLKRLTDLDVGKLTSTGEWKISRVLMHLKQGIDFSMSGYPQEKNPVFQKTVGKLAFSVFQARGKMNHSLNDPIPGEMVSVEKIDPELALAALQKSLTAFGAFNGELMPHFAYGKLDKKEYTAAHIMHIYNHLEEFKQS